MYVVLSSNSHLPNSSLTEIMKAAIKVHNSFDISGTVQACISAV